MKTVKTLLNCSVNLIQFILQHRVQVRPIFLERCSSFLSKIQDALEKPKSRAIKQITPLEILQSLVEHQLFFVRRKLTQAFKTQRNTYSSSLSFVIMEKSTAKMIKSQTWAFEFQKQQIQCEKPNETETSSQRCKTLLSFFKQILISMKEQPLFKKIISNQQLSRKFIIDYKLQAFGKDKTECSLDDYSRMKESQLIQNGYLIKIKCYYNGLCEIDKLLNSGKMDIGTQMEKCGKYLNSRQTIDTDSVISKKASEDSTKSSRRMSIFEYYDEQLQTHVISSEINNLSKESNQGSSGKICSQITEIDIQCEENDQEFQILIKQEFEKLPDKDFLKNCQKQFKSLASFEDKYFDFIEQTEQQ